MKYYHEDLYKEHIHHLTEKCKTLEVALVWAVCTAITFMTLWVIGAP